MAILAKNAVPSPMDLPIADISYLWRFPRHGGVQRKGSLCDSLSLYHSNFLLQRRMRRNYNGFLSETIYKEVLLYFNFPIVS